MKRQIVYFLLFISALCSAQSRNEIVKQKIVTYSTEAQAVFANFTSGNALTVAEKYAIARFVDSQVFAGNWSKVREFVCPHLSTQAKSLKGWKGVRDGVVIGSPTWSQSAGFGTNGSTAVINTQFVPSTDGGTEYTLNNAGVGVYIHSGGNGLVFGCIGSTSTNQLLLSTNGGGTGGHQMRFHDNSTSLNSGTTSGTTPNTTFTAYRTASNVIGYYRNAVSIYTNTVTSVGLPNRSLYLGGRNNNGTLDFAGSGTSFVFGPWWFVTGVGFDHTAWDEGLRQLLSELNSYALTQNLYQKGYREKYKLRSNEVAVYLFAGQSNQGNEFTAGTSLPYSFLQGALNAKIYYNPSLATNGSWVYAQTQTNINYYFPLTGGLVERFGYSMDKVIPNKVRIINFPRQATGLYIEGAGVDDWNVASSGELYSKFVNKFILPGLSDLVAAGEIPVIMGFDWDQGEHEASGGATTYQTDLINFLNGVINSIYNAGYNTSKCRITIKRLHNLTNASWPYNSTVRTVHENVGNNFLQISGSSMYDKIRCSAYYSTDDYQYADSPPVHYTNYYLDRKAYMLVNYYSEFVKL